MKKNIAIFASGEGSNAFAISQYFAGRRDVTIKILLSNKSNVAVHAKMQSMNIPSVTFSREQWQQADEVLELLRANDIDLIVLAGFLCIIPDAIIDAYQGRIINIHPSLLPRHGGPGMWGHHVHKAVIDAGDTQSGITIHHVMTEVDGGEIIFQASCQVMHDDTPDTLAARIHALEHAHYPVVIESLLSQLKRNVSKHD